MIGLPTRLVIAERVLQELPAEKARPLIDNRIWYMLGALGPALGDFVPFENAPNVGGVIEAGAAVRTPYYAAWRSILGIAFGGSGLPGVVTTAQTLTTMLSNITTVVQNRDLDALKAFGTPQQQDAIQSAFMDLSLLVQEFQGGSNLLSEVGLSIIEGPVIDNSSGPGQPNTWSGRDYLHWKQTGAFAANLMASAEAADDPRLVAYATGWQVSFASLLCGSGFLASIAGSVYRTYWWRTRWIANFVDAWVWGYYQRNPDVSGRDDYGSWPSLCNASLHDWIDVTGGTLDPSTLVPVIVADPATLPGGLPTPLPTFFTDYWIGAWTQTYKAHDASLAVTPPAPLFTAPRLQVAYLMTYTTLWFQTSGSVIGCNPAPAAPPGACSKYPQYQKQYDPSSPGVIPPEPTPTKDPNTGQEICGAIIAFFGLLTFLFDPAEGLNNIATGIQQIEYGANQVNWDQLECQLYWLGVYVYTALDALHKAAVLGGFIQPYASELAAATETISFNGNQTQYASKADVTCLSSSELMGPLQPWSPSLLTLADLDWTAYPKTPIFELPVQIIWQAGEFYPSAIVDDATANPATVSILDAPSAFDSGVSGSFGPAVQAALAVLNGSPATMPDWNLDTDRGLGWLTWEFSGPYSGTVDASAES